MCLEKVGGLTQGVGLAVLVGHREHANHLVTLLPQVAVHLLAEQALADYSQLQLLLVVILEENKTQTASAGLTFNTPGLLMSWNRQWETQC